MARTPKPKTAAEIKEAKGNLKTLLKNLEAERKELDKGHKLNMNDAGAAAEDAEAALKAAKKAFEKALAASNKAQASLVKKYEKAVAASDKGLEKVKGQLAELDVLAASV